MDRDFPEEQFLLDLNWYFADSFNRLCVVTSAGGILPSFLFLQDNRNDEFHEIVNELPEKFEVQRNENILELIVDLNNEDLDQYFRDFESLAKKGFYVFDKVNISVSEETDYVLVAYPLYNSEKDSFPINPVDLELIPKLDNPLISRTNNSFSNENFKIIDLVSLLNNNM
ncbi:hypothetical protein [Aquaticitalea lipolytica]|uniref:hypothetical protein n=1 Tax=Aquaticitalea lipolytica TaxID=1247562 RepID=UPI0024BAD139|nr:hypothetical protein [Aquaticitalea lipolytica]